MTYITVNPHDPLGNLWLVYRDMATGETTMLAEVIN